MSFWVYLLLVLIFCLVLIVPFVVKAVEERLELFLLLAGVAAVSVTSSWSAELVRHSVEDPIAITMAVLAASVLFHLTTAWMSRLTRALVTRLGVKATAAILVFSLGMMSGLVTALVAALALAEAISLIGLEKKFRVRLAVLGCFSIGLGAVLTPLGEPLATITMARLGEGGHPRDFWFLFRLLGVWIVPLMLVLAVLAAVMIKGSGRKGDGPSKVTESGVGLIFRALKVYVFVLGLELLGAGFNPATGNLLKAMPGWALYWASSVSAVLDNASLAAAGLSPEMSESQLKFFMLGLMLSGGMMVPGNFPNIICAAKLKIELKEWAAIGVPLGFALMAAVFGLLIFPGF